MQAKGKGKAGAKAGEGQGKAGGRSPLIWSVSRRAASAVRPKSITPEVTRSSLQHGTKDDATLSNLPTAHLFGAAPVASVRSSLQHGTARPSLSRVAALLQ